MKSSKASEKRVVPTGMGLSSLLNLDDNSDDDMDDKKKEQILQQIEEQEKAHDSYATSNSSHVIKKGRFGDFSSW